MKSGVAALIRDQLKSFPPIVDADLSGKNVLVIGANTGLGLEAVKYFARMKPARIILACRNEKKGTAAIKGPSLLLPILIVCWLITWRRD